MNHLINNVRHWFHAKGIIANSNPLKQLEKTQEELNEARDAAIKLKQLDEGFWQSFELLGETDKLREELKDGIGDTMVTLIGVCEMWGKDITELSGNVVVQGYMETLERDPFKLLNGLQINLLKLYSFVATINRSSAEMILGMMVAELHALAEQCGLTLDECLQHAYDVISKRTGNMVDGIFIKDKEVSE
jgi:hypothetical protein